MLAYCLHPAGNRRTAAQNRLFKRFPCDRFPAGMIRNRIPIPVIVLHICRNITVKLHTASPCRQIPESFQWPNRSLQVNVFVRKINAARENHMTVDHGNFRWSRLFKMTFSTGRN